LGALMFLVFTGPPPVSEWESFGRNMIILLIFFLYLFFIFPVGLISTFFASISAKCGNQLSMSRFKQS
jgi:hypothetical protein